MNIDDAISVLTTAVVLIGFSIIFFIIGSFSRLKNDIRIINEIYCERIIDLNNAISINGKKLTREEMAQRIEECSYFRNAIIKKEK